MQYAPMAVPTAGCQAASSQVRDFYLRVIVPGMEWGHAGQEWGGEHMYRLYAAEHYVANGHGSWEDCVVAVSAAREKALRADIDTGRRLLRLGPMLYETPDLAQAMEYADRSYL